MKTFLLKHLAVLFFLGCSVALHAQLTSTNNFTIYPAAQAFFNSNGKFVALGESGGVVGPTANGCDAYGFRAQAPPTVFTFPGPNPPIAVNLGIETTQISFGTFSFIRRSPVLTASSEGLIIKEQNSNSLSGCGTVLASFNEVTSSNNVFTIFGSATATGGSWTTSDRSLKRDIETIQNPMDIIKGLTGYTYEYRTEELPELRLPQGRRYGFITQEVQKVMPTAVREADGLDDELLGFQVMEYNAVIPVLTEAVKLQDGSIAELKEQNVKLEEQNMELQRENADLKETTRNLEARLARIEALLLKDGASSTTQPSTLNQFDEIRLGQNRPNPTDGNTAIDYTLPQDMTNAFLVVVDMNGRQIAKQVINDVKGMVELNTSTWASGAYVYSIMVDERVLARKKLLVK